MARWPGIPQSAWPALNRLERMVKEALNLRTDGSIVIQKAVGGRTFIAPERGFLAVIVGGANPYSWRMLQLETDGAVDVLFSVEGNSNGQAGPDSSDDTWASGMGSPRFRPAYERFNNKDVYPGTVVWIERGYLQDPGSGGMQEQEYTFVHRDGPVAAKVTTSGAPTITLDGAINDSVTSMKVDSWSGFPYRKSFRVKIDDEVIEVTQDTSSLTVSIDRAQDGTTAASHADEATGTLCDAYAWTEQRGPATGNDEWVDRPVPYTGTQVAEPARERNQACAVPDGTFVLVRRKGLDGNGDSTITSDLTQTATSVPVSDRTSFPQRSPFYIRVDGEFMKVTAGDGAGAGTFTVERGKYLSPATRHESGNAVVESICEWVFDWCCGQSTVQNIIVNIGGGSGGKLYTFGGGGSPAQTVGASATGFVQFPTPSWAKPLGLTYFTSTTEIRLPLAGWWQINYQLDCNFTFGDVSSEAPFEVETDGYIDDAFVNGLSDCKTLASLIYEGGHGDSGSSEQSETADFDHACLQCSRQVLVTKGQVLKIQFTNNSPTDAATINRTWIDGFFIGAG